MITTTQGKRKDAPQPTDSPDSLAARLPRHNAASRQSMQADEDRRLAEQWERHREHVGTKHLLTIGIGLLLPLLLLPFAGCDSPQDHSGADEQAHVMAGHRVAGGGL